MKNTHILVFLSGTILSTLLHYFLITNKIVYQNYTKNNSDQTSEKIIEYCPPDPKEKIFDPPIIINKTSKGLETNHEGEVKLQWDAIPDATSYQIKLYDLKGKLVKTWRTSKNIIYLKQVPFDENLDFTPYRLALVTLNSKGEAGKESEFIDLKSRKMKNILAPKIEGITVED